MRRLVLCSLLLLLAGCNDNNDSFQNSGAPGGSGTPPGFVPVGSGEAGNPDEVIPVISELKLTPNEKAPLSCTLTWKTQIPATSAVEFGNGQYEFVIEKPNLTTDHRVIVVGMYPEQVYQLRAVSTAQGERAQAEAPLFTTPKLPAYLRDATLKTYQQGRTYDGWTSLTLSAGDMHSGPLFIEVDPDYPPTGVFLDMQGRIVWYTPHGLPINGEAEYYPADNTILYSSQSTEFAAPTPAARVVDLAGETVWEGPPQLVGEFVRGLYSHAFRRLPSGNWLTVRLDVQAETKILGDGIVEFNPANEIVWEWSSFDHLPPPDTSGWNGVDPPLFDWLHVNGLDYLGSGETLILGARNTDSAYKLDRTTGNLLWTLGRNGDFTFKGSNDTPWFLKAHATEFTAPNRVIMFDNGDIDFANLRLWSRAVEYQIDETAKTAEIIWEYRGEKQFFAPYWGDADRLPNGNTLIAAGHWTPQLTSNMFEADGNGNTVWALEFPLHDRFAVGFYNACRFVPPVRRITPSN